MVRFYHLESDVCESLALRVRHPYLEVPPAHNDHPCRGRQGGSLSLGLPPVQDRAGWQESQLGARGVPSLWFGQSVRSQVSLPGTGAPRLSPAVCAELSGCRLLEVDDRMMMGSTPEPYLFTTIY